MTALFSEAGGEWQPIPRWTEFLIGLGFNWRGMHQGQRRIAFVSLPCDSAGAGLVALGALINDLGRTDATNVTGHYDSLLQYARQYLQSCAPCDIRCHPDLRGCGYVTEATGLLRHNKIRGKYLVSPQTNFDQSALTVCIDNGTWTLSPKTAVNLRIDGEPLPRLLSSDGALSENPYPQIIKGAQIVPSNLRESFSGLCLAGRSGGKSVSREVCASIRFSCDGAEASLPDLLTVQDWSRSSLISRLNFFNVRTEEFDRQGSDTTLVVADGDASLLKVLDLPEFQRSDVVGVFSRIIDRQRAEAIGNRIVSLGQWYSEDRGEVNGQIPPPLGISVMNLKKRNR
jgi:hypothetical protein